MPIKFNKQNVILNAVKNPEFMRFMDSSLHFVSFRMTFLGHLGQVALTSSFERISQSSLINDIKI
jgi:hypothetical protein